jgi:hypothetical protein
MSAGRFSGTALSPCIRLKNGMFPNLGVLWAQIAETPIESLIFESTVKTMGKVMPPPAHRNEWISVGEESKGRRNRVL